MRNEMWVMRKPYKKDIAQNCFISRKKSAACILNELYIVSNSKTGVNYDTCRSFGISLTFNLKKKNETED